MITQREISQLAFREKMSDRVIEKDYVLTCLLLALADSVLAENLAFKGGTALKKIYFPDSTTIVVKVPFGPRRSIAASTW